MCLDHMHSNSIFLPPLPDTANMFPFSSSSPSSTFFFFNSHWIQLVLPVGMFTDLLSLLLCRQTELQWIHEHNGHVVPWREHFTAFFPFSCSYTFSNLFCDVPWALGCVCHAFVDINVPFKGKYSVVAYSRHFNQLWVPALTDDHYREKLLWPRLGVALVYV